MKVSLVDPGLAQEALVVTTARRLKGEAQTLRLRVQTLIGTQVAPQRVDYTAASDAEGDKIAALLAPARSAATRSDLSTAPALQG